MELKSERLRIVLQTREDLESLIDSMSGYERAQVSPDWLARMRASDAGDPWTHGFRLVLRESGSIVGTCAFKGPPDDGIVEVAYGIDPEFEGRGFATEATRALVDFASGDAGVKVVRAHILLDARASKRVLEKCGFRYVGDVVDPEDGLVSRFDRSV